MKNETNNNQLLERLALLAAEKAKNPVTTESEEVAMRGAAEARKVDAEKVTKVRYGVEGKTGAELNREANELLEANDFKTYFAVETRAFDSGIFADTRQVGELTAKGKSEIRISYLEALDALKFLETEEGQALVAASKAVRSKRVVSTKRATEAAKRKAENAARKALRQAKRA